MKNRICSFAFMILIHVTGIALPEPKQISIDTVGLNATEKVVQLIIKTDLFARADSKNKALLNEQLANLPNNGIDKRQKLEQEISDIQKTDSLWTAQMSAEIIRLKGIAPGYPVVLHKDTIFSIYTKTGSFSPLDRAEKINERLKILLRTYKVKNDSLTLVDSGISVDIVFKDNIILSVTELDALWLGQTKINIASAYKAKIVQDIIQFEKDRSLFKILKKVGLVLLVIIFQVILIMGINYIFRARINKFLWDKRGIWFKGIKIRKYELIDQNKETTSILFLVKLLRFAIIIILFYLTLPIIFSIFPFTHRIAEELIGYIITPLKKIGISILGYLPELITIVVIVFITVYLLKFIKFLSKEVESERLNIPRFYPDWAKPTYNIIKLLVLAFMFVVIFPYLPGSDSPIFKGVSVFIGVIVSLSSSSILGNMMAGLVITYMRPFKKGDMIKIGDVMGNVVEKTAFVTRIRTPKKESITIPNSNILASNVFNYSNSKIQGGLIVHTTVTIGYDAPWRKVHQLLTNAAKKTSHLNLEIAPFVLQTELNDFSVSYQLNAHTNEPDLQPRIYSELHENIQDEFNEAGIEILSPNYLAARDGNTMAIPEDYIPEGYEAPGFKLKK